MADFALPLRSEKLYRVKPAVSLHNEFAGITIPQNPGLAENNWNGSHQDSYCSESVGLKGPTSNRLRVVKTFNPYGLSGVMGCNEHNQMIGMASDGVRFNLIVFDTDGNILSATPISKSLSLITGEFGGAYFYLDQDGNTIAAGDNKLQAYPTGKLVIKKEEVYALEPLWKTGSIVREVTGGDDNSLYSAMPVWGQNDLYWCLLGGKYDVTNGQLVSISNSAYIAVVQVTPSPSRRRKASADTTIAVTTTVLAKKELNTPHPQYNNNSFASTEEGAVFVTNGLDASGYCYVVSYTSGAIVVKWQKEYRNSGYLKVGHTNIGSGTTPTIMVDKSTNPSRKLVAITDNAYPQMNVVVYDFDSGEKVQETPLFSKMRSANEASVIGVNDSMFVPNNFGHTMAAVQSQCVSNEPGLAKVKVGAVDPVIWEQDCYTFFGMSMLARESGIIFSFSGEWYDEASATEGPVYYILAIDSFDGRVIWRIPIGRGRAYCHEYGGIYFDRTGTKIFVSTNKFLVSVADYETESEQK